MLDKLNVGDVKLQGYDSFFGNNKTESSSDQIQLVALTELYDFRNHPFKIHEDKLNEMAESIKEHGVLIPGVVRRRPYGGYEIIAGHTRKRASELAGLDKMPVIIKDIDDDEAVLLMVDSNIQRENILPSEKAKAYKMKYQAIKNQGHSGNSLSKVGEENGDKYKTVQRYIWLSNLSNELLEMVDNKRLGFSQGIDLSWLTYEEQELVYNTLITQNKSLSVKESALIKQLSKDENLTELELLKVLMKEKNSSKKIVIKQKVIDKYFNSEDTQEYINEVVDFCLDKWMKEFNEKEN